MSASQQLPFNYFIKTYASWDHLARNNFFFFFFLKFAQGKFIPIWICPDVTEKLNEILTTKLKYFNQCMYRRVDQYLPKTRGPFLQLNLHASLSCFYKTTSGFPLVRGKEGLESMSQILNHHKLPKRPSFSLWIFSWLCCIDLSPWYLKHLVRKWFVRL